ncbi:MAG: hypothetical protein DLM53_00605 [Candidatus Eremiobacter antarcticus]|nr:hypothetical protein [Candidatus Eremiobacteraeota bacterium]PZR64267.1 MAG: hypothetical protein DLM53_00605 [Candidatus Eremiobacter sp. RRmetagenome_bin22]
MLRVVDEGAVGIETDPSICLQLNVSDPVVVQYLRRYEPQEQRQRAEEALKMGVVALLAVSPTLDASIVDQKFKELQRTLEEHARGFARELEARIEHYFKSETGTVPRHLDALIGGDGAMSRTFEEYFGLENGRLNKVVQDQIGPQSEFGRLVDPDNSRGLLHRIQGAVELKLQETSAQVLEQFSLDLDGSALSRLRREVNGQVEELKRENARFFADLKAHLGIEQARREESAKGTQKGRDFETAVYEVVAAICRSLDDVSESLTSTAGDIPRCKIGDYVSTLGLQSGAPGKRIVLEAKNCAGYTLRSSIEELKQAKENRNATVGIMVFSDDCCPAEIGKFRIVGRDIFVAIDEDAIASGDPQLYLESAYRIGRAMAIAERNQQLTKEMDTARISAALAAIQATCERFAEIRKKAVSIKQSAAAVEELANCMRPEVEHQLREMEMLVRTEGSDSASHINAIPSSPDSCAEADDSSA